MSMPQHQVKGQRCLNMPCCTTIPKEVNKAKQPESGDLCDNITEFGVVEGSPEPAG